MISVNLQGMAEIVVRQAQRNGYVLPGQVRSVLIKAGICESKWKDVVAVAGSSLTYRKGRYYYNSPVTNRVRQEQEHQNAIRKAVREIIHHYRRLGSTERREEDRLDFVQSVKVKTEDGREFTMLTRDLSSTGIRLIGTRRFLGQKLRVSIPAGERAPSREFVVRILWTCAVGDDLVESGGSFVEVVEGAQ